MVTFASDSMFVSTPKFLFGAAIHSVIAFGSGAFGLNHLWMWLQETALLLD